MDRHQHQQATKHAKKPSSKVYVDNGPLSSAIASAEPSRPQTGVRDREAPHTAEHSASTTSSTGIATTPLTGRTTAAGTLPPSQLLSTRLKQPPVSSAAKFVSRLSHDISTEQLISDQLVDGHVADGDDDEEDNGDADSDASASASASAGHAERPSRDNNSKHPPGNVSGAELEDTLQDAPPASKGLYRIESHSALSSLEAKNMVDRQQQGQSSPTRSGHEETKSASATASESSATASRSSPSRPHKLSPLSAIASNSSSSGDRSSSPKHTTADPIVNEHSATGACDKCTSNKEMPPMHCAAYSGHAQCLEALLIEDAERAISTTSHQQQQTQKRQELDKKHRTPLFYACAANRMDCVALLLVHRASWRDLPDKQLDTPVHVCCFFGWHDCLAKLLDAGANPHGRNAKGFKPSHIAKTKDCLALLLSFGDDLLQGDKLSRTPLFVASARDRTPCVEFLCAWNHQTRSWMLEQEDQRGDRPIHAAACNGSVAALEILLKYGADPLMPNGKTLTPKDLATANGHVKCVEILTRAEEELAKATTWYAPANAMADSSGLSGEDTGDESNQYETSDSALSGELNTTGDTNSMPSTAKGWIECWDYDSGQPFYYHNLSGKCQWEVPPGFTPQLQQRQQEQRPPHADKQQQLQVSAHEQYEHQNQQSTSDGHCNNGTEDDDGSEYVWVKKKKQTVCVVTGKATEWTAVQDPASRAIYYKNARTGQSQWEEPDAVQQLQSASGAHAAQEATRIWDELDSSRNALAAAIAREKHRQLAAHHQTLENYKSHLRARREEMQKREEQARLQQLLPRSSFVRRKKQSMMMMKVSAPPKNASSSSSSNNGRSVYVAASASDERLEQICAKEPALDIFLSTYLKLQGVRDLQVMTTEKRFCNCLFHYYTALVDPLVAGGLSKSQFRVFLRDAAIIPSGSSSSGSSGSGLAAPLKLHIVDLIFAQAARAEAIEASSSSPSFPPSPTNASHSPLHHHHQLTNTNAASSTVTGGNHLTLAGFTAAMQIVRDRVVTQVESQQQDELEIEDDEEWFLTTFLLPLTLRLGARLVSQIRECKELDLQVAGSVAIQELLATYRQLIQQIHRHYSSQEPKLKMLSFRGLSHFTLDFGLLLSGNLPALHQLYEAVNWISGNAHTEIISFEKFQQLLVMLACFQPTPGGRSGGSLTGGVVWRAVPAIPSQAKDPELSTDTSNKTSQSTSDGGDSRILTKFFQQLERSPAKHRIKTELAMSASKILSTSSASPSPSFSPPKLMSTGQSSRSILS
ncbi:hypothetical protein Gpo141_00013611, partial [Globisporangium polare]